MSEAEGGSEQGTQTDPTRVAIACQGGGSHTAFTAGVLKGILDDWDEEAYELVGISGASGGAFNALAVWYGLVTGDEAKAVGLLDSLWEALAAREYADRIANDWVQTVSRLESAGAPIAQLSPYQIPGPEWGKERIRSILEDHIDFEAIPDLCERRAPELVVGTVDVHGGVFETFTNEDVTTDAVLASAAVPNLFQGVEIDGHLHWDGLFSQNPPVDDLLTVDAERKPEELWVIQINPQAIDGTPTTVEEIADRRNELSGNISLNQELRFVQRVNTWIEQGQLSAEQFSKVTIRRIEMREEYHCTTKLDRSPPFIEKLMRRGEDAAADFLADPDSFLVDDQSSNH